MGYKKVIYFVCIFSVICFDTYSQDFRNQDFKNEKLFTSVFEKLYQLQTAKRDKVNIVHIGDSHVQADILTDAIRQILQARFGNGGYGFSFPYKMAKTNGTRYVKYTSNTLWQSHRNISPVTDVSVGLSGIGLYTDSSDFEIKLQTNPSYAFTKVKLLYPTQEILFKVCLPSDDYRTVSVNLNNIYSSPTLPVVSVNNNEEIPEYRIHVIRRKETLYSIARKNKTTVAKLQEINNLSSSKIHIGLNIMIPIENQSSESQMISIPNKATLKTVKKEFNTSVVLSEENHYLSEYIFPKLSEEAVILPTGNSPSYNLSGVVLENDQQGVIYHSIGVNGAKVSDYNKYPLFFEQLPALSADLIIVSLGTNESFGKWDESDYMSNIQDFVSNVRAKNSNAIILFMTPAPSLFKRRNPNTYIEDYAKSLLELKDCIVWDLLTKMGGVKAPLKQEFSPFMAKDKIHYTIEGYKMQGELFSADFLKSYDNFVKNRKK